MTKKSFALAYLTIILCIWPINVCLAQDPSEMIGFLFGGEAEAVVEGAQLLGETVIKGHNCGEAVNSYNNAKYYYEHGQYILALKAINESIKCWEGAGFFSEYDIVYAIDPDDSWGLKGEILNKMGRWEEAIDCCNNALDLNYKNAYAWAIMGDAFFNLKLYQKSIECYDDAITIDSSYRYAYLKKLDAQKASEDNTHSKDKTTYLTKSDSTYCSENRLVGGFTYKGATFNEITFSDIFRIVDTNGQNGCYEVEVPLHQHAMMEVVTNNNGNLALYEKYPTGNVETYPKGTVLSQSKYLTGFYADSPGIHEMWYVIDPTFGMTHYDMALFSPDIDYLNYF